VFILIPATLLAAALIVASSHQPKLTIALTVVGTVVLLQIGYMVGMIARAIAIEVIRKIGANKITAAAAAANSNVRRMRGPIPTITSVSFRTWVLLERLNWSVPDI
jgi:hypothetical protein